MASSTPDIVDVSKSGDSDCPLCIIIWLFMKKFAPTAIAVLVTGFVFLVGGMFVFCWFKRRRRPFFPETAPSTDDYAIPCTNNNSKPVPVAVRPLPETPEVTKREKIPMSYENRISSLYMDVLEVDGIGRESTTDPEVDYIHAVRIPSCPLQRLSSGYDNNMEIESLSEDSVPNPLNEAGGNLSEMIPNGSTALEVSEKSRVESDLDCPTMPVWDTTVLRDPNQYNITSSCIDLENGDQTDNVALQRGIAIDSVHPGVVNTAVSIDSEEEETNGSINEGEDDIKDLPPPPVISRMSVIRSEQEEIVWPRPPSFLGN